MALASSLGSTDIGTPTWSPIGLSADSDPSSLCRSFKEEAPCVNRIGLPTCRRRPGCLLPRGMRDERALDAIARVEAALARIEAAADRAAATRDELTSLQTKHQSLRGRIEEAVAQIDRLLDAEEN
jgi:hypothetical protein